MNHIQGSWKWMQHHLVIFLIIKGKCWVLLLMEDQCKFSQNSQNMELQIMTKNQVEITQMNLKSQSRSQLWTKSSLKEDLQNSLCQTFLNLKSNTSKELIIFVRTTKKSIDFSIYSGKSNSKHSFKSIRSKTSGNTGASAKSMKKINQFIVTQCLQK
jgi:hypothetical protein